MVQTSVASIPLTTTKPTAVVAESYEKDIESYLDSQERLRHLFKKHKRKLLSGMGLKVIMSSVISVLCPMTHGLKAPKYGISFKTPRNCPMV